MARLNNPKSVKGAKERLSRIDVTHRSSACLLSQYRNLKESKGIDAKSVIYCKIIIYNQKIMFYFNKRIGS